MSTFLCLMINGIIMLRTKIYTILYTHLKRSQQSAHYECERCIRFENLQTVEEERGGWNIVTPIENDADKSTYIHGIRSESIS